MQNLLLPLQAWNPTIWRVSFVTWPSGLDWAQSSKTGRSNSWTYTRPLLDLVRYRAAQGPRVLRAPAKAPMAAARLLQGRLASLLCRDRLQPLVSQGTPVVPNLASILAIFIKIYNRSSLLKSYVLELILWFLLDSWVFDFGQKGVLWCIGEWS